MLRLKSTLKEFIKFHNKVYLTQSQLDEMGFKSLGENVLISDKASIYGASNISIGNNVRIDDFCIISIGSQGAEIGSYVHISCHSLVIGKESIKIGDFAGISSRVSVYSSSDDYTGEGMTNPTIPDDFRKVDNRAVELGRHCIVGSGSIILPGVTMGEGSAIGALSKISKDCLPFGIYSGNPARKVGERSRQLLALERSFIQKINKQV